jgi:hypothetical protein
MSPEQRPHVNSQHQPETVSTANRQTFEDPDGGLPLDSPLASPFSRSRCQKERRSGRFAMV